MVMKNFPVLPICIALLFFRTSTSLDSITPSQPLRDGQTLVSSVGAFELGFFSPGKTKNRYVGIWYKHISPLTVVWVANREAPLSDGSGILAVNDQGILVLVDSTNRTVWSSNNSIIAEKPIARLLDTGNLIISDKRYSDKDHFIWQSFDYPCDTLLPGMKLGLNLVTGLNRFLSSWKSPDDPSQGEHILKLYPQGYPQSFQLRRNVIHFRAGSWNGLYFTGYPVQKQNPVYMAKFVFNDKEAYYEYELVNSSVYSRITMSPSGMGMRLVWSNQRGMWEIISANMADQCDNYGLCGAYSICDFSSSSVCECLKGFMPKNVEQWNISNWSGGCVQSAQMDCSSIDGFRKYRGVKLPDTSSSQFNKTMNLEECQQSCQRNCSCTAFANLDIRDGGSGCLLWFNDLIDMKQLPQGGQDIFIRVPASELDFFENKRYGNFNKRKLLGIAVGSVAVNMGMMLIILGLIKCVWKRKVKKSGMTKICHKNPCYSKLRMEDTDLQIFDLSIIAKATDNFSSANKLGEGGFGPVYKGALGDGQELAVKRLSENSVQGFEEFKNEVLLIAKLQHRNLVKLLGCCIEREEKLIYEYMPNRSLDHFIFDESRSKVLDWTERFHIINGIARGLLYLHEDSRLRVIHRDLKTSNILLDTNLNPKISDFGLARTFWGDQIGAKTSRIAGTYGYMPPEYAMHGHFSIKSDVFSFGVIVLEMISGKKNREFSDLEDFLNLLGYAWRLWREGMALELMDQALRERFNLSEVMQCIQVGLLCVQQRPEDRPDMSSVVLMLNGEKSLADPGVPAFYIESKMPGADSSLEKCKPSSPNEMSLTIFEAR
ncbi:G-type lectin S-receptor-like serine/threonine-protein kinase At4g27290 [Prosopis cineraria]|uniref:G-type lectin S-receptor-like serine/threonine-protein kinase At4g27290 n=1 Tax=Prosopis cineraria TaxID=364024 RepID=UPI0024107D7F|nr:G-type lectin S-receptor-like serine/threonine-protein kinase At4g27290 [Prosopis cineraria]